MSDLAVGPMAYFVVRGYSTCLIAKVLLQFREMAAPQLIELTFGFCLDLNHFT
jgi:hypothetical protein